MSGVITASKVPPYFTGQCHRVQCPPHSVGEYVDSGCKCESGFTGNITCSGKVPFYSGECRPCRDDCLPGQELVGCHDVHPGKCSDLPCPPRSTGDNIAKGCRCKVGMSGVITASKVPPYFTGQCHRVQCPPHSVGEYVDSGCKCESGFTGNITCSGKVPFYSGECRPCRDDCLPGQELVGCHDVHPGICMNVSCPSYTVRDELTHGCRCPSGMSGSITALKRDPYFSGRCTDVQCPPHSWGSNVRTGCQCLAGYAGGSIVRSHEAPFYSRGCDDVPCPAFSSGPNVAEGCTCIPGAVGSILKRNTRKHYFGSCTPVECPIHSTPRNKSEGVVNGCSCDFGFQGYIRPTNEAPYFEGICEGFLTDQAIVAGVLSFLFGTTILVTLFYLRHRGKLSSPWVTVLLLLLCIASFALKRAPDASSVHGFMLTRDEAISLGLYVSFTALWSSCWSRVGGVEISHTLLVIGAGAIVNKDLQHDGATFVIFYSHQFLWACMILILVLDAMPWHMSSDFQHRWVAYGKTQSTIAAWLGALVSLLVGFHMVSNGSKLSITNSGFLVDAFLLIVYIPSNMELRRQYDAKTRPSGEGPRALAALSFVCALAAAVKYLVISGGVTDFQKVYITIVAVLTSLRSQAVAKLYSKVSRAIKYRKSACRKSVLADHSGQRSTPTDRAFSSELTQPLVLMPHDTVANPAAKDMEATGMATPTSDATSTSTVKLHQIFSVKESSGARPMLRANTWSLDSNAYNEIALNTNSIFVSGDKTVWGKFVHMYEIFPRCTKSRHYLKDLNRWLLELARELGTWRALMYLSLLSSLLSIFAMSTSLSSLPTDRSVFGMSACDAGRCAIVVAVFLALVCISSLLGDQYYRTPVTDQSLRLVSAAKALKAALKLVVLFCPDASLCTVDAHNLAEFKQTCDEVGQMVFHTSWKSCRVCCATMANLAMSDARSHALVSLSAVFTIVIAMFITMQKLWNRRPEKEGELQQMVRLRKATKVLYFILWLCSKIGLIVLCASAGSDLQHVLQINPEVEECTKFQDGIVRLGEQSLPDVQTIRSFFAVAFILAMSTIATNELSRMFDAGDHRMTKQFVASNSAEGARAIVDCLSLPALILLFYVWVSWFHGYTCGWLVLIGATLLCGCTVGLLGLTFVSLGSEDVHKSSPQEDISPVHGTSSQDCSGDDAATASLPSAAAALEGIASLRSAAAAIDDASTEKGSGNDASGAHSAAAALEGVASIPSAAAFIDNASAENDSGNDASGALFAVAAVPRAVFSEDADGDDVASASIPTATVALECAASLPATAAVMEDASSEKGTGYDTGDACFPAAAAVMDGALHVDGDDDKACGTPLPAATLDVDDASPEKSSGNVGGDGSILTFRLP
eukprot:TRINITY_DN20395_c0_g1_i3.p1 TRINITY_DN20395_c0_g1~~TRINITY_DN20395_c0_g1_i3.p1  ORF type:complete len:1553 (+),score=184.87 TRINITY_DN20395_c0_g1_i3:539-4660(+)